MALMGRYHAHNMGGADHLPGWCSICGKPHPERHHVVPRSLGGSSGPVVHLCGFGGNLRDADGRLNHHGAVEQHLLWFWWHDGTDRDLSPQVPPLAIEGTWLYRLSGEPCSIDSALRSGGWRIL